MNKLTPKINLVQLIPVLLVVIAIATAAYALSTQNKIYSTQGAGLSGQQQHGSELLDQSHAVKSLQAQPANPQQSSSGSFQPVSTGSNPQTGPMSDEPQPLYPTDPTYCKNPKGVDMCIPPQ